MRKNDPYFSRMIEAAHAGDERTYTKLLQKCEPLIRRRASRIGTPSASLDDTVQETLLSLHNSLHMFDQSRSFTGWLSVITKRRTIENWRRGAKTCEVHAPVTYENRADQNADPYGVLESNEDAKILRVAISRLPPNQREAIERLALKEQSLAEASAQTGRTTGALKVSFHRGVKALRFQLSHIDENSDSLRESDKTQHIKDIPIPSRSQKNDFCLNTDTVFNKSYFTKERNLVP